MNFSSPQQDGHVIHCPKQNTFQKEKGALLTTPAYNHSSHKLDCPRQTLLIDM